MIEELRDAIIAEFGAASVSILPEGLQATLLVRGDLIKPLCFWLRDHQAYYFDFLANLTAVDYHPEDKFALVYNLTSIPFQNQVTLKVELPNTRDLEELPQIDSVSEVWRTADWHEREAFDLMGIFFVGHPDLRRILLPDDWQGYPLRKEYTDAESYHGIPIKS